MTDRRESLALRGIAIVAFLLLSFLAGARIYLYHAVPGNQVHAENGMMDFHDAIYFPALAYRQGVNPYGEQYASEYPVSGRWPLYSPAILAIALPFTLLPLDYADGLWFVLNLAGYLVLSYASLRISRLKVTTTSVFGLTALVLASRPGHINLVLGQVTLPMVLATLGVLCGSRSHPKLASFCLFVTSLKPTYFVPLAFCLWIRGERRLVYQGAILSAGIAALALLPILSCVGLPALWESMLGSHNTHVTTMPPSWSRLDLMATIERLFGVPTSPFMVAMTAIVCLVPVAWYISRLQEAKNDVTREVTQLTICLAIIACIFHNSYDLLLLVPFWLSLIAGPLSTWQSRYRVVLAALLTIPAVNYLSTRIVIQRLELSGAAWNLVSSVNGLVILATLGVCLWALRRATVSTAEEVTAKFSPGTSME